MGVIHGFNAPWTVSNDAGVHHLDAPRAALFLRAQASWLQQGLDRVDDPAAIGIVLGTHDASHESWCALICALEQTAPDLAADVSGLYAYHGRIVGSLERGLDRRLEPSVRAQVHAMLAKRLTELTATVGAALESLPADQGSERVTRAMPRPA